jgi:ribonuclease Z|uniref:Uncharacterized protein n=1 Tax=Thorea hispida TaxID=202687 RepID=A0A1C9CAI4_9FLOR|nr:hypothetical protein Thor_110 [Thorea hispida]AOM65402.1 hypothetical protein Thor_110 [Thorea hispida]UNJ79213.1 hypothetical protein [Thorea hispida]
MYKYFMSFLLKNNRASVVYLYNCPEGSQHLLNKLIKHSQVSTIIITNLSINNIAGFFGLLSTFSLNSREQGLTIYGPPGVLQYIQFIRKYSHTTFRYVLSVYIVKSSSIYLNVSMYLFSYLINQQELNIVIVEREMIGRFKIAKARGFQLLQGPLYKRLKKHYKFILPDGSIVFGKYFTDHYYTGIKLLCLFHLHSYRSCIELKWSLRETIISG